MAEAEQNDLTTLTVTLLSAYVANNNVQHGELSELIKTTHGALKSLDMPEAEVPAEPEYKPAVSVRKSIASPDHIISLIDGKSYQTLKRHLKGHGLTPAEYRARYSLPVDYPMVAKAYSESRRAIAAKLGLGRRSAETKIEAAVESPAPAVKVSDAAVKAKPKPAAKAPRKTKVPAKVVEAAPSVVTPAEPKPVSKKAVAAKAPAAPKARKAPAPKAKAADAAPADKPAPRKRAPRTEASAS